jgi:hypothetical protein
MSKIGLTTRIITEISAVFQTRRKSRKNLPLDLSLAIFSLLYQIILSGYGGSGETNS